jgi:hypothetical protein
MMDSITERLKEQCICQAYDGPGKPACVECDAVAELDRLTEMVDQLTHFIETNPVQLVADLRRELAEAQRDAARYRWITQVASPAEVDAAIDAAMASP